MKLAALILFVALLAHADPFTLLWDKSASPEATGYRVYASTNGLENLTLVAEVGDVDTTTVQAVRGVTNYFGCSAFNTNEESALTTLVYYWELSPGVWTNSRVVIERANFREIRIGGQ